MPISFVRAHDVTPQYAVFGKLRHRADFVRINATHPVTQEFDDLLARSLSLASRQAGWSEAGYFGAGSSDFHYTSSDGRWCYFGALHPSRDEAGRLYPLVAGAILPAACVAPYAAELSIANELFFSELRAQLASAADDSVEMLACRQFLDAQLRPNPHADADLKLAAQVLEQHLQRTPAARLQADIGDIRPGGLEAHLLAFAFQTELLRRYGASIPRQALMLPLPGRPGEDALGHATWLALHRAAAGSSGKRIPDFISIVRDGRRYLAVAPERFGERALSVLWGMQDPGSVLDVASDDAPWMRHRAYAEASYILSRQLRDPAFTLKALLAMTERLAANLA